jgi:GT2 family glycosyltransferase
MAVYNGADTIGQQLAALEKQTYQGDWEIIVADNGSTDNTVKIVQDYQARMPHLRLIHAPEKQGKAYAINLAAQAAQGNFFLFCDADDMVAEDWLAIMAEALKEHEVAAGAIEVHTLNRVMVTPDPFVSRGARMRDSFLPYAQGCNMGVSRRAFEAVGGFSEPFLRCQDVDFSWRLQLKGYHIHDVPKAVIYYRFRENVGPMWEINVRIGETDVQLYRKFAAFGMPGTTARKIFQKYLWLIKRLPRLWGRDQHARLVWVGKAGVCWGRLRGSLLYRTFYL